MKSQTPMRMPIVRKEDIRALQDSLVGKCGGECQGELPDGVSITQLNRCSLKEWVSRGIEWSDVQEEAFASRRFCRSRPAKRDIREIQPMAEEEGFEPPRPFRA